MIYNGILNRISNLIVKENKVVGKNLFNKDASIPGKSLEDGTGEVIDSSAFYISDYIEVLGGRAICITNIATTTIVAMYDENKSYIGQYKNTRTFVLDGRAAYVRIGTNATTTPANTQQIEYGEVVTAYEPYKLTSIGEIMESVGEATGEQSKKLIRYLDNEYRSKLLSIRNIFDPADNDLKTGYYLNVDGIPVSLGASETKGWVSGYMPVLPNCHYVTNLTVGIASQYFGFYTFDGKVITTKTAQSSIGGFDTPENCYFVRITINKNDSVDIVNCQVELGIVLTPSRSFYDDESKKDKEMLDYEGNLIDKNNPTGFIQGYFDMSLVFHASNNNFKTTDYIRVNGGQYYLFITTLPSTTLPLIFFDETKKVIEYDSNSAYASNNLGFIKVPSNAVYMMVSINIATESIILKNTFYKDNHYGYKWYKGNIEKETDKYKVCQYINPAGTEMLAYHNGMYILRNTAGTKLYIGRDLNNIFTSRAEINISSLPNIGTGTISYAHIFQRTGRAVAVGRMVYSFVIITDNSKIYNYTYDTLTAFSPAFTESSVWIGIDDSMPQMQTDETKGGKHGLKVLPNNDPNGGIRLSYFRFLNSNVDIYSRSGQRVFEMGGYTGVSIENGVNNPYDCAPTCLYTTEDGVDFYVTYMFGFSGSRYRMAGGNIASYPRYKFGEDLNTASFGAYGGGLKMKVRLNVVPSSNEINPTTSFEYLEEVNITAVTNAAKGVFTLSDASNVHLGDCVCITGSASGDWEGLINDTASTTSGGNGIFFMVTSIDGNNVTLATCVGNPNNPLFCTHCHAVSPAWNGVILSTGEEYPESWLIYVDTYQSGYPNYRINSSEKGISRSCGVVVRPDNKFIYAADTATGVMENFIGQINGRTDKLKVSPLGLWKFDMADVDDHSKFELIQGDIFSVYALRKLSGTTLYAAAQGGESFLSFDNGDSFEKVCQIFGELGLSLGSDHDSDFFFGRHTTPKVTIVISLK